MLLSAVWIWMCQIDSFMNLSVCRLEEIGASASKEFSLEKSLEKMKQEWTELRFGFSPYKDTVKHNLMCVWKVI